MNRNEEIERLVNEYGMAEWSAEEGKAAKAKTDLLAAIRALPDRYEEGAAAMREAATKVVEGMVIGGRAWTEEQAKAAEVLFEAARRIRSLPTPNPEDRL